MHIELKGNHFVSAHFSALANELFKQSSGKIRLVLSTHYATGFIDQALLDQHADLLISSPTLGLRKSNVALRALFSASSIGLPGSKKLEWLNSAEGADLWAMTYKEDSVQPHLFCFASNQCGQFSRVKLQSSLDLNGLKVAVRDIRKEWLKSYSIVPKFFSTRKDMIDAMRVGQLDLADRMPHFINDEIYQSGSGPYYLVNHDGGPHPIFEILTSKSPRYSSETQALLKNSIAKISQSSYLQSCWRNESGLAALSSYKNLSLSPFPQSVEQHMAQCAAEFRHGLAKQFPIAREICDSYARLKGNVAV